MSAIVKWAVRMAIGAGANAVVGKVVDEFTKELDQEAFQQNPRAELVRVVQVLKGRGTADLGNIAADFAGKVVDPDYAQSADLHVPGYSVHDILIGEYLTKGQSLLSKAQAQRVRYLVESADDEILPKSLLPKEGNGHYTHEDALEYKALRMQILKDIAGYAPSSAQDLIGYLQADVKTMGPRVSALSEELADLEAITEPDADMRERIDSLNHELDHLNPRRKRTGIEIRLLSQYAAQIDTALGEYDRVKASLEGKL